MTIEKAIELRDGTRVLVEAEVTRFYGVHRITERGNVALRIRQADGGYTPANVSPEVIAKITSPRRKFCNGDVVYFSGKCWELVEDETDDEYLYMACGPAANTKHVSVVKLVCAVEDRADRSAAADGFGVTRKGGEA